ncbi:uncharacterized protein F5891DRAFT_1194542 [Suillus fuscotomentosus]|uniref:LAA1-like C-terminal TPR repeats domain-containing protein n=1 Tax=Suillus fuscotomentosus TaxID=1912939 RepID=A0AAD4HEZ7_9AGAM|nr:uncharacterized protein F5891DRAFT_1194542 [Suillus fuscotomentosus]KAG1895185.1 hypothetical protein F5891DRAFT_1194542 [Suillus fuscotomentosus]
MGSHTQSSSKESQSNATIPPDSVYTHCLKVFAYILWHSRHNPGAFSIRSRLLSVLLPTITLLLRPSQMPPSTIHSSDIAHLLSLAASSPASFKEATTQLDPSAREVLKMSIRNVVKGAAGSVQQSMKPQISLRLF